MHGNKKWNISLHHLSIWMWIKQNRKTLKQASASTLVTTLVKSEVLLLPSKSKNHERRNHCDMFHVLPSHPVKSKLSYEWDETTDEHLPCRHIYVFSLSIFSNHLASMPLWFARLICSELSRTLELYALRGNQGRTHRAMFRMLGHKLLILDLYL